MGKILTIGTSRSGSYPPEFRKMPLLLPPDMGDHNNKDHLWMVGEAWRAPAIDGVQACVRGPIKLPDGCLRGFFTDGISVPQLAWSVFDLYPFSMPELCGALGHDIVYSAELVDRKTCDRWMNEWERMAKVSACRRYVIYKVLKTFGGLVWDKHTEQSIAEARTMCQLVPEGQEPVWGPLPNGLVTD